MVLLVGGLWWLVGLLWCWWCWSVGGGGDGGVGGVVCGGVVCALWYGL